MLAVAVVVSAFAQVPRAGQGPPGPPGGPGFQGAPAMPRERAIVAQFDKDKDGRLNAAERKAAREFLASQPAGGRGPMMMGRGGAMAGPVEPGPRLTAADVKTYGNEPLYHMSTLRTIFLEFEADDWEAELLAFNNTDVDVPATVTVDRRTYRDVGVHFRGASSFFTVPAGRKHSLNLSMDFVHGNQRLRGYSTLNLLNSHVDPTYLRTVLYLEAARSYSPAPKANYVRVVINGESWGIYVNTQQFNREFINEWYKTTDGARWKVPGSPGGRAGLEYRGDDPAPYKALYEIKSKDDPKAWAALINLTRVLNETPPEQLEKALAPILDVDGALKFLALEATLVNDDGYWVRASDYSIYLDPKGRFHLFPHDANETFFMGRGGGPRGGPPARGGMPPGAPPPGAALPPPPPPPPPGAVVELQRGLGPQGAPGRPGGRGAAGPELDPLIGLTDSTKPLRSKLLAVPALRERYMGYVRDIAAKWLDWNVLAPKVARYQALIAADVKTDTRKLDTFEAFEAGVETLRTFVERRRAYLATYKD